MAVACGVTVGNVKGLCDDKGAVGGIQAIYVIQQENVVSYTPSAVLAEHSYTAVSVDSSVDFYGKIEPLSKTASATAIMNISDAGGGNSVDMNIEAFLPNQEQTKGAQLSNLTNGGFLDVIVHFNTDKAFVYGYDEKLKLNAQLSAAVDSESGTDFLDRNGYVVKITGTQTEIPRQFIGSIPIKLADGTISTKVFTA